ncbi:LysE/ArgO family amino acid transporter [Cellulomonas sp. URHD0024]|uniref:LysE/ArgO family amino acid transporter n=1 Tax=Cellulomonas sp. URHD0024 TaxID=1302620 RepID=UPI000480345B|nr:LysE/ArgO family amino acid transporter [Cellulomonas sp. URHD0024]
MLSAALAGFLTMMSLIVAIGAQNAFVLRQGIRREHVLPVVVLCSAADALLIVAGIAGLGAVIANHPAVLTVTKYVGAVFLLVLAFGSFRRAQHPEVLDPAASGPASLSAVVTTCLALTFLNPNVYLDTVVLIGSLAHQHEPDAWVFGFGAALASIVWFVALGFGAGYLRPLFARPRAWQVLDIVIGLVVTTIAVLLVL